jgi:hypothetical protein
MRLPCLVVVAVSFALLGFGCQREPSGAEPGSESGETGPLAPDTGTDELGAADTETEEGGDFIPDEEPEDLPPPPSCREMLDCVFMCLGDLGLECISACGEGFDSAEVQKAGALLLCLGQQCFEKEQCTLTDFTAADCVGCIGLGLFLPKPPGCEEQAAACQD